MNFKTFIKECNNRDVFKRLSIYLVSCWLLIQVLDVTSKPLGLPDYSVTILLLILIIGFPVNMYLVWVNYAKNLKIDEDEAMSITRKSFKKIYFALISFASVIAMLLSLAIVNNNFLKEDVMLLPKKIASNNIAISRFGNNTGDASHDDIGKMASDWLIHGITENNIGQTVSPKVIDDYTEILKTSSNINQRNDMIRSYFNPGKIITGNYFLKEDKLILQGFITDGTIDEILISFKSIECSIDNPLECIESLKQLVLGYLITEKDKAQNLQETPPVYKAYKLLLEAKSKSEEPEESLKLLDRAIAIDSTYFEAKVLRVANYYNRGLFREADSLRKLIKPTRTNNKRQQNLLNFYHALIEGNNRRIYSTLLSEYNNTPFDLKSNQSTMTVALEFVNKPEVVSSIFDKIITDKMSLDDCEYCQYRIYAKAKADIELKNYDEVIQLFKDISLTKENTYLFQSILIATYIRSNNISSLKNLEASQSLIVGKGDLDEFYTFSIKEFLLQNNQKAAKEYAHKLLKSYNTDTDQNEAIAKAYYTIGEYEKSKEILVKLLETDAKNMKLISLLAKNYFKIGDLKKSTKTIAQLSALKKPYEYGEIEYEYAGYYSVSNQDELALDYLKRSIAKGNRITLSTFQNDPDFIDYFETKEFKDILTYWH